MLRGHFPISGKNMKHPLLLRQEHFLSYGFPVQKLFHHIHVSFSERDNECSYILKKKPHFVVFNNDALTSAYTLYTFSWRSQKRSIDYYNTFLRLFLILCLINISIVFILTENESSNIRVQ